MSKKKWHIYIYFLFYWRRRKLPCCVPVVWTLKGVKTHTVVSASWGSMVKECNHMYSKPHVMFLKIKTKMCCIFLMQRDCFFFPSFISHNRIFEDIFFLYSTQNQNKAVFVCHRCDSDLTCELLKATHFQSKPSHSSSPNGINKSNP